MNRILLILNSLFLLVGCADPAPYSSYYTTPNAAATLAAAEVAHEQAANDATAQTAELVRRSAAATETAHFSTQTAVMVATGTAQVIAQVQTSTAESLSVRASEQAISARSTYDAIGANATATAVAQAAVAERYLVEDEAHRLALQREAETAEIEYQRQMNELKLFLWGGLVLAIVILASAGAYVLYQHSRPITVSDVSGPRVLIPANGWQVLPANRSLPALPAPTEDTVVEKPIALPPLARGHVLIAGETGSGKSTAMLAVLKRRQQVIILDPHDSPGVWGDAQVIGGGRNFEAIGRYMAHMGQLLSERYSQRAQGRTTFDPLTVATDEMPAIVAALGRQVDEIWREWLREGRKVSLFFVVSTQSVRVKTLGIRGEGDLLENFNYVLVLGKLAAGQYPDLTQQMERPAVLRELRGVRPVIIPNSTAAPLPTINLPEPSAEEPEGFADPNNLTSATQERIRQLARALPSQAAVERAVFGYNGGAAYRAVKLVLDQAPNSQNGSATTGDIS